MSIEKKRRKTDSGVPLEHCILCGKQIGIRRDTPIKERKYYVETAGQLCADCYAEVYLPAHNDNILN